MKKIIYLVFIFLSLSNNLYSSDSIFETNFYNVDINNEFIENAKIREINKIKKLSFESILYNILTEDNFKKFKRFINIDEEINYIIKNIIIEDEFISSKKYKAKIKINYDFNEIVRLLRKNKINYTDYKSPEYLVVVVENIQFSKKGLTKNNSFYNYKTKKNTNLLNIKYPDLSVNDRFILPYDKILKKDILSLTNLAKKYNTNFIFVIHFNKTKDNYEFNISIFSSLENSLKNIDTLIFNSNLNYQDKIFNFLNSWWKKNNYINNSIINSYSCIIKNSNLHELHFINSIINSTSQVKSNLLNQINFGLNIQDIVFYGDLSILSAKLSNEKIKLYFNSNNECIISTSN